MPSIYDQLMQKAAEWRNEAAGMFKLDDFEEGVKHALEDAAEELEAIAKQVCAEALKQMADEMLRKAAEGLPPSLSALFISDEVIGGPK